METPFGSNPAPTPPPAGGPPSMPTPKPGVLPTPSEPELVLSPEKAQTVKGEHPCAPGDEYTAQVRLKVKSTDDTGGITFEVPEITNMIPAQGGEGLPPETMEDDEVGEGAFPEDEEKMLGYRRPKGPTQLKNVAKSLQD